MMDGISVKSYLDDPYIDANNQQQIADNLAFFQYNAKNTNSRVFLNVKETNNYYTAFVITKDGFTGDDGSGIKLTDSVEKLIETHGKPIDIFETTQGQIFTYPTNIYYISKGKIFQWITYGGKKA